MRIHPGRGLPKPLDTRSLLLIPIDLPIRLAVVLVHLLGRRTGVRDGARCLSTLSERIVAMSTRCTRILLAAHFLSRALGARLWLVLFTELLRWMDSRRCRRIVRLLILGTLVHRFHLAPLSMRVIVLKLPGQVRVQVHARVRIVLRVGGRSGRSRVMLGPVLRSESCSVPV